MRFRVPITLLFAALAALAAAPARADIAILENGMTFKVSDRRVSGEDVVLVLKEGGEVTVPAAFVRGVVPDEIVEEVAQLVQQQAAAPAGAARDVRELAREVALRHGLDPALVLAVISVESAFRPDAVSPKGAQGLMQLMPGTAESLGVKDALDPEQNLDGGSRYLRSLITLYGGDVKKALAAYNAGPGAVRRHKGIPPYRETREYVTKVMSRYEQPPAAPAAAEAAPPSSSRKPAGR